MARRFYGATNIRPVELAIPYNLFIIQRRRVSTLELFCDSLLREEPLNTTPAILRVPYPRSLSRLRMETALADVHRAQQNGPVSLRFG
jgi:hypothetical protein